VVEPVVVLIMHIHLEPVELAAVVEVDLPDIVAVALWLVELVQLDKDLMVDKVVVNTIPVVEVELEDQEQALLLSLMAALDITVIFWVPDTSGVEVEVELDTQSVAAMEDLVEVVVELFVQREVVVD